MKATCLLKLLVPFVILTVILTGCGPEHELTEKIVGKWKVLKIEAEDVGEYEPKNPITFEFRADDSFTVENQDADLEPTEPANPFHIAGTSNGFYHVDAPKGFDLRYKYLEPVFYSAVEVDGDKLQMQYTSGVDQRVTVYLEKMN